MASRASPSQIVVRYPIAGLWLGQVAAAWRTNPGLLRQRRARSSRRSQPRTGYRECLDAVGCNAEPGSLHADYLFFATFAASRGMACVTMDPSLFDVAQTCPQSQR